MRVTASKKLPAAPELIDVLRSEFSSHYSYRLFGLGKNKSIIVGGSKLVGVQISASENEFTIQATVPSVSTAYFFSILSLTEGVLLLAAFFGLNTGSRMRALEKDVAIFLRNKYS